VLSVYLCVCACVVCVCACVCARACACVCVCDLYVCTPVYQLSSEKQSSHYTLLPAVFNPLPNREVFEKELCNLGSQYEKYGKFSISNGKPSCATIESTLFTVSKDELNTKEGTGKSWQIL